MHTQKLMEENSLFSRFSALFALTARQILTRTYTFRL